MDDTHSKLQVDYTYAVEWPDVQIPFIRVPEVDGALSVAAERLRAETVQVSPMTPRLLVVQDDSRFLADPLVEQLASMYGIEVWSVSSLRRLTQAQAPHETGTQAK